MRHVLTGLAVILLVGSSSSIASERDCRVLDVPSAKGAKRPTGCELPPRPGDATRLKQQNGFIDLGNGTQVRVSGRVRVDVGRRN